MNQIGEIISLTVAVSWTITALFAEVASKRLGSTQLNVIRLTLSLLFLGITLFVFTGSPFPLYANKEAWFWLLLSGFVGYVFGDFCLFNAYVLIGSRFGQLFMTLAPVAAAFFGWVLLGEHLSFKSWLGLVITVFGIGLSVLNRGSDPSHKKIGLKLPFMGVLYGIGAGVGQGVGLVLSKVGMTHYAQSIPEGMNTVSFLMPFASTWIRALCGTICFWIIISIQRKWSSFPTLLRDKKGMKAAVGATIFGPFVGVSLSLMAVEYTQAGIAQTLMSMTPILILWPTYKLFKQRVSIYEIVGAIISVLGASLFFI